jgi:hypothetical protein
MCVILTVKRNNTYLWCILPIKSPHVRLQDQNFVPHRGEKIFLFDHEQIVCGNTQHRGYSSAKIEAAEALSWQRTRGVEINFNVDIVIMLKISEMELQFVRHNYACKWLLLIFKSGLYPLQKVAPGGNQRLRRENLYVSQRNKTSNNLQYIHPRTHHNRIVLKWLNVVFVNKNGETGNFTTLIQMER